MDVGHGPAFSYAIGNPLAAWEAVDPLTLEAIGPTFMAAAAFRYFACVHQRSIECS